MIIPCQRNLQCLHRFVYLRIYNPESETKSQVRGSPSVSVSGFHCTNFHRWEFIERKIIKLIRWYMWFRLYTTAHPSHVSVLQTVARLHASRILLHGWWHHWQWNYTGAAKPFPSLCFKSPARKKSVRNFYSFLGIYSLLFLRIKKKRWQIWHETQTGPFPACMQDIEFWCRYQ